jgi:drug/metabolite transporter (DMT)-like permease
VIDRNNYRRGVLSAVLAALCWGSSTVMSKVTLQAFTPLTLLVLQLMASVIFMWLLVWVRKPASATWTQILAFSWLGLLEPGLAYVLALTGLADTGAGAATLIISSESIMIVGASAILFGKRPSRYFLIFSIFALGGLFTALGVLNRDTSASMMTLGTLLLFCGTAVAALYVVLSARIATQADSWFIVACQQTTALLLAMTLLPFSWKQHGAFTVLPSGPGIWLLAVASGVIQYALAFSLYMRALRSISANVAGTFLTLVPLFGLGGAILFLHETLSLLQVIGVITALISLMLISRRGEQVTS